jgi:DNA modification methylase
MEDLKKWDKLNLKFDEAMKKFNEWKPKTKIKLFNGDCLIEMQNIPDKSIDAIICDLPYGTTACKWDSVIPFEPLWEQYKRVIKDNGAIVLFGSEPFSSALRMSNIKMYRYDIIWEKSHARGFLNAWKQPMRKHENISLFYKKQPTYNPILKDKDPKNIRPISKRSRSTQFNGGKFSNEATKRKCPNDKSMPDSVLKYNSKVTPIQHPTQKPLELLEYLVKTYSNKNDTILDNTMGSGTTMLACKKLGRNGIGIEKEKKCFKIAQERVNSFVQE